MPAIGAGAYQLHTQRQRFNDDGEPSGSAGRPILAPIVGHALFDVLIVVIRYFGGTKLGPGGLVRAYSQAANAVIASAETAQLIQKIIPKTAVSIQFDYSLSNTVNSVMAQLGLAPSASQYNEHVQLTLMIADTELSHCLTLLKEHCAGQLLD